ncbi:MAG: ATP-binding protein [Actinomycetota bacterium]|nr:ATP-binding protein [Actinomycetota bacterium]
MTTRPPADASRARRAPPWWPEGEQWPPRRPPWHAAPRRFRRRLLLVLLAVLVALVGFGFLVGLSAGGGGRPWGHGGRDRGPGALVAFAGLVAVVGGSATLLAYRRISGPVGDLLGAAQRLGQGDYEARVEPDGPRELRSLITTFNEMAGRLAASEDQRRRFLADVTHELRTPLAVLQSGIEAQVDGIHPRDDRHLLSLLEETQLLGRLVDDLHTLAMADAGRLALHPERTHPSALVEDAVESHAALAERQGVTISSSLSGQLPELDVDPRRIRQVLVNLLSNAIRHVPGGGAVSLRVEGDGKEVRFTVTDSGPGFAPDQLAHLFERFSRSADSRGSGLGLSIAHDLVLAHGGTIRAFNGPTGGATVSFTLPTAASSHPKPARP